MAKLNELFDVFYGSNIELSNTELSDKTNGYPFVSRTEKNNGISTYVIEQPKNVKINPANSLSVSMGGTVLETFYQDKEYYSGRDIAYLLPKEEMTKEEMIYYALCIRANKIKYSYGRQANRTLKDIELPDFNQIPTWVNNHKVGSVELLEKTETINIDFKQCEDIFIFDLFEVVRGKSKPISDMVIEEGKTPIISSTGLDNGITGYTNFPATFNTGDNEKCLTLAIDGSIGSCFYQNQPFIATGHVAILQPRFELNKYHAIYISSLLRKEGKLKYSFGRAWDLELVKNTQLKLPTKDGGVDWQLIEDYIKSIERKYKINENSTAN